MICHVPLEKFWLPTLIAPSNPFVLDGSSKIAIRTSSSLAKKQKNNAELHKSNREYYAKLAYVRGLLSSFIATHRDLM